MLALFLIASFPSFADQTWGGGAAGSWNNSANWSGGTVPAASEVVIFNTPDAVVSVDADTTIKLIRAYAPATLTLNSPLHIVNAGTQGTDIRADLVINGPSTLDFSRNGTSTTDLLDLFVRNGATLTVNAKLTGANSGIETWAADNFMNGTYVFANPANDFPHSVSIVRGAILSVPSLGLIGSASCLGTGTYNAIRCSYGGTLRITGDASFTTDRPLYFYGAAQAELLLDAAGNGDMSFTGSASSSTETGTKTLRLGGNGTGTKTYAGAIAGSSQAPIALVKQGLSEWRLSGANNLTAVTLLQGTLTTANPASLTTSAGVTLAGGTLRVVASALNLDGTFTASPLSVTGPTTLSLATGSSNVLLPALALLAGGTLDILPADPSITAGPSAWAATTTAAPTPVPVRWSWPATRMPGSTGPSTSDGPTPTPRTVAPTSCWPATDASRPTASTPPPIPAGKAPPSTAARSSAPTPRSRSSAARSQATTP